LPASSRRSRALPRRSGCRGAAATVSPKTTAASAKAPPSSAQAAASKIFPTAGKRCDDGCQVRPVFVALSEPGKSRA